MTDIEIEQTRIQHMLLRIEIRKLIRMSTPSRQMWKKQ